MLPSGRVAVVGGEGETGGELRADGEALDLRARVWEPLPPLQHGRTGFGLVAVAGGMLAVGGGSAEDDDAAAEDTPGELFDEALGRWFELPHRMAGPALGVCAVSLAAVPPAV